METCRRVLIAPSPWPGSSCPARPVSPPLSASRPLSGGRAVPSGLLVVPLGGWLACGPGPGRGGRGPRPADHDGPKPWKVGSSIRPAPSACLPIVPARSRAAGPATEGSKNPFPPSAVPLQAGPVKKVRPSGGGSPFADLRAPALKRQPPGKGPSGPPLTRRVQGSHHERGCQP